MNGPADQRSGVFSRTAAVWLVLVGVLSFVGLLVLTAYAPQLRGGGDGGAHALSRSAVGFAGVARLLKARGEEVIILRGPLRLGMVAKLVIVTPDADDKSSEVAGVPSAGPWLVILPKWNASRHPMRQGWVVTQGMVPADPIAKNILDGYGPRSVIQRRTGVWRPQLRWADGRPFPIGPVRNLQTFTGPYWTPVIVDETGAMVLGRTNDTYFLADPDLMNTQGISDLRTARAAMAIVDALSGPATPIVFDVTLHGFKQTRSVLRLAFEPPFLGATLCLALAALLMGMHAVVRFGPIRESGRAFALGKEALVDNTAALVRMAKREHRMAERYALAHRAEVAKATGAPPGLEDEALNAFLDRAGQAAGAGVFSELLAEARCAANPTDLMTVARKLYDWRVEMTRERR